MVDHQRCWSLHGLYQGPDAVERVKDLERSCSEAQSATLPPATHEDVASGLRTLRALFTSGDLLLGAPQDWADPGAFLAGQAAMQWTGLWAPDLTVKYT